MLTASLLAALVWVVCAGFAAVIASGKGRSAGGFALLGLLLGPLGLLGAAFASSDAQRRNRAGMVSLDEAERLAKEIIERQRRE